jgi:hypothetical protein
VDWKWLIDPKTNEEREAAAAYVAELNAELAIIAHRHGFAALGYILEMARLEAENATSHVNGRT